MRTIATVALALLITTAALAQQEPSPDRQAQLKAMRSRFGEATKARHYAEALKALQEMADAPEFQAYRGDLNYDFACLHALLGHKQESLRYLRSAFEAGYSDFANMARDSDLDSLRDDAEFKALTAELEQKYGPRPLAFDPAEKTPEFPLAFDDPSLAEYARLRTEFKIDEALAGARDDYERLQRLAYWTSRQWQHSPDAMASKSDPLTILAEARRGGRFICMNYAVVLVGAARSYGLPSRVLALLPKNVETRSESHSVAEVWLPQFRKWVIADAQWGIVPEIDGKPLGALELQAAIASADNRLVCRGATESCAEWRPFILRNAYYFKIANQQRFYSKPEGHFAQLVLVPKGAPHPHKFAGAHEELFANAIYTSNPDAFYAPPALRGNATSTSR